MNDDLTPHAGRLNESAMTTTAMKVPWSQRINFRLVLFIGLVAGVVGWVMWQFVQVQLTGGIIDKGGYMEVDLKAMSSFEMDPIDATDESVPRKFRELEGKRALLVGEMYQPYSVGGRVSEFDLVYSIAKCCVTSSPKIQHFVKSKVLPGKEVEYFGGLVKVMGRFHVGVEKANGRVRSVYRIDVESVKPVE